MVHCKHHEKNQYIKKIHDQGTWLLAYSCAKQFTLFKCHTFIDEFMDIFSLIFYLVVIRLAITNNSVVKSKDIVVNHESRLVKSNLEFAEIL